MPLNQTTGMIFPRFLAVAVALAGTWAVILPPTPAPASEPLSASAEWMAQHYTKYEYRIPMRDGVKLFTQVFIPKDDSHSWPILLTRTPYALKPYGVDNYPDADGSLRVLAEDGFVLARQDVRGRYGSEGAFLHMRPFRPNKGPADTDESTDAFDTIDWLVKHVQNNNGKVGMFGISYPGFYTSMGMIDSHPALKAASPQAPIADWFMGDDLHHNGAFFLAQNFDFFYQFSQKVEDPLHEETRPFNFPHGDGYDFFLRMGALGNSETQLLRGKAPEWTEFLAHPTYDAFWQARNLLPHLQNVHCAVLVVGGWYDAEDLYGTLETYRAIKRLNPSINAKLVMGPWAHGDWGYDAGEKLGHVSFHSKTGEMLREKIELAFFQQHLKGGNAVSSDSEVFETGSNQWRHFKEWPPQDAEPRQIFLRAGGRLAFTTPSEGPEASDEYVSDPAKPTPFTMELSTEYPKAYPVEDQRFATSRPDVLAYETDVLEEDLTVAGPIDVDLRVSTTGTDADWVVKVIDVYAGDYPDIKPNQRKIKMGGYQQLVRGDVFRGRFRNSFEKPEPMTPGQVTRIPFTMRDVFHTFRRGHRLMVQVQSSWFPLVDRNPQTYVDIASAKPEDFRKATQHVFRSKDEPSSLAVRVLPEGAPK